MKEIIYLGPNQRGFKILYSVNITNSEYFNINQQEKELFEDKKLGITCKLCSSVKGQLIRDSKNLLVIVGVFSTVDVAKEYAETFVYSLKYYLSKNHCSYNLSWKIKDLSVNEITLSSKACLSLLKPFTFGDILPIDKPQAIKAIELLEKAEKLSNTELRFFLYVVVLESILDNDETKQEKTGTIINLLDDTINFVNKSDAQRENKDFLINKITQLRYVGSRNAVKKCINKYFPNKKIKCCGVDNTYFKIYNVCYDMRNRFVHSGIIDEQIPQYLSAISQIAYDVVYAYANDKSDIKE